MALRLEVAGVRETREHLRALLENLNDMESLWGEYATIMVATEEEWFTTSGQGTWPPLAQSTLREKALHGWPLSPLIREGNLLESLTDPARAMEVGQGRSTIGTFTRNAMTWGTDAEDDRGREYAHFHQGSDPVTGEPVFYGGNPPQRQPIPWPLPAQTLAQFEAANEAFVAAAIERSQL